MAERILYYMCKYTPVELFAGFGVSCERLESDTDNFDTAESIGHPNMCGYGKGLLEAAAKKQVKELVLVNCCDVVRRIYDILKQQGSLDFLYLLDLPHKKGPAETALLAAQLRRLQEAYGRYSGIPFDEEAFRKAWGETKNCAACPDGAAAYVQRNRPEEVADEQGPCISLQGAHSGAFLPEMIRRHFPVMVRDDTCVGNRQVAFPDPAAVPAEGREGTGKPEGGVWLSLYAQALLEQVPCMRMTDVSERKAPDERTAGVIYHTMKFCDYYGFEYAGLPARTSVPILKIETDGTRQSEGQLATRLDAFAESLHMEKQKAAINGTGTYAAGVDSGSTSTEAVILDAEGKMAGWSIVRTGSGAAAGAKKALQLAMDMAGIEEKDLLRTVSTGYGRETIGLGNTSVTEITCHARGAHYLMPSVRTIIDIGGQDSKIIRVDAYGAVISFVMNDKCAAGTGRFLEMMARTMDMTLEEMSARGLNWKENVKISSMCTVFAESEVVSLIARNTAPEDIIHGLNESVASRTAALLRHVAAEDALMMTGGVAQNRGVVEVLEKKLASYIHVSEYAQLCGAIGAALLAREA